MASLTHVCMWSDKGWKRISASDAARLHPGGTVSAHSGLFMCELCGQYVLLTDGSVQVRHFRHSSAEKSKDCPERKLGAGAYITYDSSEHELPIKIIIFQKHFELEMGLISVPKTLLTSETRIQISSGTYNVVPFIYSKERLNSEGITYLSIGTRPYEKYRIVVSGSKEQIYQFWPKEFSGIDPTGTIFDGFTGKKLVYDSDVVVGKKYYLLKRGTLFSYQGLRHVTVHEIASNIIIWENWKVYEVTANDYDKESASFFLDYHCRLTECPVSIQPVWPVYVQNPYIIKHNRKKVVLHISGNAPTAKVFPYTTINKFNCGNSTVAEISANSKQQLISTGRTKALQYLYFWQEKLDIVSSIPQVEVSDLSGKQYETGVISELPERKTLCIVSPYDARLIVRIHNTIIDKRKISADIPIEAKGISWNTEIQVIVGCDCVWSLRFIREADDNIIDEEYILNKLKRCSGGVVSSPPALRNIVNELNQYPLVQQWIYKCLREGKINVTALRELQTWFIDIKKKRR